MADFPEFLPELAAGLDLNDPERQSWLIHLVVTHLQDRRVTGKAARDLAITAGATRVPSDVRGAARSLVRAYIAAHTPPEPPVTVATPPALPAFCAELAAGLDLNDADDRATFRALLSKRVGYTKVEVIKQWAFDAGVQHVRNSRNGAVRALADAYIASTGAPTGNARA